MPIQSSSIVDNLFKTVLDFVEFVVARNQEENFLHFQRSMDRVLFNKEFNTLKIGLPRRTGNTTLALMIFQHYPSSILIVQNQATKRDLTRHPLLLGSDGRNRIFSKAEAAREMITGYSPSVVVVDTSSYLTERELENFFLINSNAFILLG